MVYRKYVSHAVYDTCSRMLTTITISAEPFFGSFAALPSRRKRREGEVSDSEGEEADEETRYEEECDDEVRRGANVDVESGLSRSVPFRGLQW